ncbi:MAG: histidine phosphatase family protein [Paludibacteraceae bacterium]|nr:histidine phosphatase family protein [Paludibacteraceae bacterium]
MIKNLNGVDEMRIVVIRHGKVLHNWKKWCSSVEFDEQCALYDSAPIDLASINAAVNDVQTIYISTLDRTLQTAKKIFGEVDFKRTSSINEVPLRSGFDTAVKMPLWFWNVLGRLQWLTRSKRQPENKIQTAIRAEQFASLVVSRNENCAVVTHGVFMHALIKAMKKEGFQADKNRVVYRAGEAITLTQRKSGR